ncbi:uncharacterized protein LOC128015093 [Carassius gibelio]|uniref:uncharacterized protein LOC128015093 n=1 Tax=Carassius gibelio TaxID=101364 RepID=UPI00227850C1|nr:uncharacterized protein LOC128015093 [Carassius gibelio]
MLKSGLNERNVLYRDKLLPDARKRYLEKMAMIGNLDPYEVPSRECTRDPDDLPPLTFPDIFVYLVCGVSAYTEAQFRNFKSMEAHVQFTNGWVHDLEAYKSPSCENTVVRTKVMHSQRLNEPPLKPWVIVSSAGKVECAHCTCMAGIAETCTHVGALLFKLEATVRIRGTKTVTDVPAYWVLPSNLSKIHPEVGYRINYTSSVAQRKTLDQRINMQPTAPAIRSRAQKLKTPPGNLEDLSPLLDTLLHHSKAVGLSGMEKYYAQYTQHTAAAPSSALPPCLAKSLYDESIDASDLSAVLLACEKHINAVSVTEEQAVAVEEYTRQQHLSSAWYDYRSGRITASKMHAVYATSLERPSHTVFTQVCYPHIQHTVSTVQTRWGISHEGDARKAYTESRAASHTNFKIEPCGFIINSSFPEIGASPDGLTMCECCGKGCLEVKCPFKYRSCNIQQALDMKDKDFCLQLSSDNLQLKRHHRFYTQIQTQIFVTQSNHCDLVVWTENDFTVVRVFPDQEFWEPRLQKAQEFFKKVCLPELVAKYHSKDMQPHVPSEKEQ